MNRITDEMVEVAKLAYGDATLGSLNRWAKEPALRAALEAAAPMIRAERIAIMTSPVEPSNEIPAPPTGRPRHGLRF